MSVEFADWSDAENAPLVQAALSCPCCGKTNSSGLPARLLWVVRRHSGEPKRRHQ